jgi:hypothetical protein
LATSGGAPLGVLDLDGALAASSAGFTIGATVLTDLSRLVAFQLPHEFEALLGRYLALSRYAVLPASLPDAAELAESAPELQRDWEEGGGGESAAERRERLARFFSYWPSMDSLIEGALRSAGLTAAVRTLGSLGGAHAAATARAEMLLLALQPS